MPKRFVHVDEFGKLRASEVLPLGGFVITFSINAKNIQNRWLHYGGVPSNQAGFVVPSTISLDTIVYVGKSIDTGTLYVKKHSPDVITSNGDNIVTSQGGILTSGTWVDLHSFSIDGDSKIIEDNVGITLGLNDELAIFLENASGVNYPVVTLFFSL